MQYLALLLLILGLILLLSAERRRRQDGLPAGRVVYLDAKGMLPVGSPLYDPATQLIGKPDYLVRSGKYTVPVEVKSGRGPSSPYPGHLLQLAAYCLLVEANYGLRPPHGILKYRDRTFEVEYAEELENRLLDALADMRRGEKVSSLPRSHQVAARCRGCGYRDLCDQRLPDSSRQ